MAGGMEKANEVFGCGDSQTLSDIERCYPEIGERYNLLQTLGRGGQGLVVKALERQSDQDVAVKIFDLSEAENWKAYELFEREVEVLRYLDICGVPKYIDYEKKDHYYYLVEEYIEAPSLQEQIEAGVKFTEAQVMTILRRCLEILTQLHQKHPPIIHRDIKPSNILTKTRDDGLLDVWLIDFGSVTSVSPKTQMSTIAGTSGYAPPEQFMGKSYPSSDLYALGMSMVHVLTGKLPNEMMTSRLKVEYASHLPPSLSEHLKTWLARIIVSNPKERIQTAKEALKSLNIGDVESDWQGGEGSQQQDLKPIEARCDRDESLNPLVSHRVERSIINMISVGPFCLGWGIVGCIWYLQRKFFEVVRVAILRGEIEPTALKILILLLSFIIIGISSTFLLYDSDFSDAYSSKYGRHRILSCSREHTAVSFAVIAVLLPIVTFALLFVLHVRGVIAYCCVILCAVVTLPFAICSRNYIYNDAVRKMKLNRDVSRKNDASRILKRF